MKTYREDAEQRIAGEQAAHWLYELAEGGPAEREAFVAWLKRSPRHVGEFLLASTAWKEFGRTGVFTDADIDSAVREAMSGACSNVIALQGVPPSPDRLARASAGRWILRAAAAVAAIALCFSGFAYWSGMNGRTYATAVGEQRAVRLADGSLLHLNARSRVAVEFSEHTRDIRLLEGEALFSVERDTARPFRVNTGNTIIEAIGTQFDVHRTAAGATVSVMEGAVQISNDAAPAPVRLLAGEQARIRADGKIVKHTAANLAKALAWRERRMVFQDDRLEDIVAEVNRYGSRPIRVEGEAARGRTITGTFDADDTQSLLLFLGKLDDLQIEERDDRIVIRERQR